MSGRIEQENKLKNKIEEKLSTLPRVFSAFYSYMEADDKTYATIKHYINTYKKQEPLTNRGS